MGSQEDPKLVTTTVHAYDTTQLRSSVKGQVMGVAMMAFMHLYLKYTNPLVIQSIIPLKGALEGNLAKIYLYGSPASGDLKRPWKAAGGAGLAGMLGGAGGAGEIKTDKASIEAAEKSGRGGVKEEVSVFWFCRGVGRLADVDYSDIPLWPKHAPLRQDLSVLVLFLGLYWDLSCATTLCGWSHDRLEL